MSRRGRAAAASRLSCSARPSPHAAFSWSRGGQHIDCRPEGMTSRQEGMPATPDLFSQDASLLVSLTGAWQVEGAWGR